jgi:hypothetical protein
MIKLLLLALFAALASATPNYYVMDFTLAPPGGYSGNPPYVGITPTSASFYYDAGVFYYFDVDWDGEVFDLTAIANAPEITANGSACSDGSGGAETFAMLNCPGAYWMGESYAGGLSFFILAYSDGTNAISVIDDVGCGPNAGIGCVEPPNSVMSFGSMTATDPSNVPEPDTAWMVILGVGVLFLGAYLLTDSLLAAALKDNDVKRPTAPRLDEEDRVRITCAAINHGGKIYEGTRHGIIMAKIWREAGHCKITQDEQGFMTSDGHFVNRRQAGDIAFMAGQTQERKETLLSEHVW